MSRPTPVKKPKAASKTTALSRSTARRKRPTTIPDASSGPSTGVIVSQGPKSLHVFQFPSAAAERHARIRLNFALKEHHKKDGDRDVHSLLHAMIATGGDACPEMCLEDELVTEDIRHARRSHQIKVLLEAGIPQETVTSFWSMARPSASETKAVGHIPLRRRFGKMARELTYRAHRLSPWERGSFLVWEHQDTAEEGRGKVYCIAVNESGSETISHSYDNETVQEAVLLFSELLKGHLPASGCLGDALSDLGFWEVATGVEITDESNEVFRLFNREVLEALAAAKGATDADYAALAKMEIGNSPIWSFISRHPLLLNIIDVTLLGKPGSDPIQILNTALRNQYSRLDAGMHLQSVAQLAPLLDITARSPASFNATHLGHLIKFGPSHAPRTAVDWISFLDFYGVFSGEAIQRAIIDAYSCARAPALASANDGIDWVGRARNCIHDLKSLPNGLAWQPLAKSSPEPAEMMKTLRRMTESMEVVRLATAHLSGRSGSAHTPPTSSKPLNPMAYPSSVFEIDGADVPVAIVSDKTIRVRNAHIPVPDLISGIAILSGDLTVRDGLPSRNLLKMHDAKTGAELSLRDQERVLGHYTVKIAKAFQQLSQERPDLIAEAMDAHDLRRKHKFDKQASELRHSQAARKGENLADLAKKLATLMGEFQEQLDRLGILDIVNGIRRGTA